MKIISAKYNTSVVEKKHILNDGLPEFAFVGRSNVGKSSLINSLTGTKGLAKTSATPGKTKMINYFDINDSFRFVDLPGYGYAKVGKSHLDVWSGLMGEYLLNSPSLLTTFLLLDIRHNPTEQDKQMLEFLVYNKLPFCVIATKADKIAKSKQKAAAVNLAKVLNIRPELIICSSSEQNLGKDKILEYIETRLET
ncbi:MAG: YihA family ribosome biogenesis GTP-binding protein [Clostridia bacterium]|nr:YihA family ribosome biogenesis GTP-binding protein [Clostridia bacterium]